MKNDLISRSALIAEYDRVHVGVPGGARKLMVDAPAVDAELVHYGRWVTVHKGNNNYVECSECRTVGSPFWKRCPLCEAKMDGDAT